LRTWAPKRTQQLSSRRHGRRPSAGRYPGDAWRRRVASTHVHGLLQQLLGYETPLYAHHRLLTDATGRRFAKRDCDMTIRALRESGATAEQVIEKAVQTAGISPRQLAEGDL
jgi:hypothetical protein